MKNLLLIVFTVLMSQLAMGIASADSLLSDGPAPPQQFQSADSTNPVSNQAPQSEAAAIAKVKAIMARSKRIQTGQAQASSPVQQQQQAASAPASSPAPSQPVMASAEASNLGAQINDLSQNNNLFQQQTDQRLETLSNKNKQLEQQVNKLDEAMTLINQEMNELNGKQSAGQSIAPVDPLSTANPSLFESLMSPSILRYGFIVLAVLVLLLLSMLILSRSRRGKASPVKVDDTQDEYDFMGSDEGIPAKLDLARAYLAMGDNDSARQVLAQVMLKGDASQKQSAVDLLKQIR